MRLTLFSRVVIGYLAIFILVLGASVYAIDQLRRLNAITRSVLETDNRILDYEAKLADTLLEEIRYERKFLITHDETLYDQFLLFKNDFEQYLEEANFIADSRVTPLLKMVKEYHQSYQDVFNKEIQYVRADQSYPEAQYKQDKAKAQDAIMAELEKVRAYGQQSTYSKVRKLDETGAKARQVTILVTATSLIFIVAVSLLMTRSITHPIAVLKNKTREIARGNFGGDLSVSSPPEIAELAGAFNLMCQKLRDLDKMKSDFFSSMSHELRTPLASIKEGTGLLLEGLGGPVTEKQQKLLTILAEESSRLIDLVNSLLDLSKMEAGMMTYHFDRASLAPLIRKAMTEIGPLVEAKRINLQAEIEEQLPPLKMDGERMLQALRNLIGNAVKFTPETGRIIVSARHRNGGVEVAVTDTGPGIPHENLANIFDKYQQGSRVDSYRTKGTGLGLAIVKHIITSHGGRVWAESKAEDGSTFTFVLSA
jgi:two-component system, NtrC family, sensor histidine kinase GlrK